MFGKAYRLPFRLLGIPVLLDLTFLIILPLFAWIIGSGIKSQREIFGLNTDTSGLREGMMPYLLGFLAVVGLFISVVIHELGHAVTARMYGVQTRSITLWLLGGVAQLESIPRQRGAEAVVAIVGPLVSTALAAIFWGGSLLIPQGLPATHFVLKYLALTNLILAIFNLLPALPLDGGRVLRSLLALRLDYLRATQLSASISKVIAIGLGIFGFMTGDIMLLLVAFFVFMAVNSESQQLLVEQMLSGIRVRDLMNRDVITVSPQTTAAELTATMIRERHQGFPVLDPASGRVVGMVNLERLQGAAPETPVSQIMSPDVHKMDEFAPALEALTRMSQNNFARIVVTAHDSDQMVGIITKHDLIRAIQIRLTAMYPGSSGLQSRRIAHAA